MELHSRTSKLIRGTLRLLLRLYARNGASRVITQYDVLGNYIGFVFHRPGVHHSSSQSTSLQLAELCARRCGYVRVQTQVNSLPNELQSELHLPRRGRGAADRPGRARNSGGSEHDQIGSIEIGSIQEIKNLRAELQGQAFVNRGIFQD